MIFKSIFEQFTTIHMTGKLKRLALTAMESRFYLGVLKTESFTRASVGGTRNFTEKT